MIAIPRFLSNHGFLDNKLQFPRQSICVTSNLSGSSSLNFFQLLRLLAEILLVFRSICLQRVIAFVSDCSIYSKES